MTRESKRVFGSRSSSLRAFVRPAAPPPHVTRHCHHADPRNPTQSKSCRSSKRSRDRTSRPRSWTTKLSLRRTFSWTSRRRGRHPSELLAGLPPRPYLQALVCVAAGSSEYRSRDDHLDSDCCATGSLSPQPTPSLWICARIRYIKFTAECKHIDVDVESGALKRRTQVAFFVRTHSPPCSRQAV